MRRPLVAAALLLAIAPPGAALANTVTPIAEIERGTMVTVAGTVEEIRDYDEFRLVDDTGSVDVDLRRHWVPADMGEAVTVTGFVDDDGRFEIMARDLTRADGSVVRFERRCD